MMPPAACTAAAMLLGDRRLRRTRAGRRARSPPACRRDRAAPACRRAPSALPSGLRKIFAEDGQRASRALRARQRIGDVVLDRNAVARERDRGRDQLGEREACRSRISRAPAPAPPPCRARRSRARESRDLLRIGIALLVEEHVARGRGRRGLAIVDGDVAVARRRDGSPCSRRRRYCRRADRSPPARSRSRPRHRPRCRRARSMSTPMRAARASCATTMPLRATTGATGATGRRVASCAGRVGGAGETSATSRSVQRTAAIIATPETAAIRRAFGASQPTIGQARCKQGHA